MVKKDVLKPRKEDYTGVWDMVKNMKNNLIKVPLKMYVSLSVSTGKT